MEIEENRGLIDKKNSEDQLASFHLRVLVDISSILSLSHTLGHLEFSCSTLGGCDILGFLEQEGKGKAGKYKEASGSTTTSNLLAGTKLHVCFLHYF